MEKTIIVSMKSPRNMNKGELQLLLRNKQIPFSTRETIKELTTKVRDAGLFKNQIVIPTAKIDLKSPILNKKYAPIVIPKVNVNDLQNKINELETKQSVLVDYIKQLRNPIKGRGSKVVESQRVSNELLTKLQMMGFNF
jgi:hypothetical protein